MTQSLAYSIKRLREVLQARYKMTNLTTQDVVRVEFQSAVHFPEAIQTINQLVELVAEMRKCISVDYDEVLTKADALLTKLKE